jgi:hypothetical protein
MTVCPIASVLKYPNGDEIPATGVLKFTNNGISESISESVSVTSESSSTDRLVSSGTIEGFSQ